MATTAAPLFSKAEKAYITSSLSLELPHRTDGRAVHAYRNVALETGNAQLANGSAHIKIGGTRGEAGAGGTEVRAGVKLEVTSDQSGRNIAVTVTCSPAAYPHLSSSALDDLQSDLTAVVDSAFSHSSLLPSNLSITPPPDPHPKSWRLSLDLLVLSSSGNVLDALFLAARAALADTRVPRTREVVYRTPGLGTTSRGGKDAEMEGVEEASVGGGAGLDTRRNLSSRAASHGKAKVSDFELVDYWDEGEPLDGKNRWPIGVTMNLVNNTTVYFLDATLEEESASPNHVFLAFSFPDAPASNEPAMCAMRQHGPGEVTFELLEKLIKEASTHATTLHIALDAKIRDEEIRRGVKARTKFAKERVG